jgi:large subunit ribosomal protein L15
MRLHDLKPADGSKKRKRRVGRGDKARRGAKAGRGTKGTGARDRVPPGFEGGQMPLKRRQPKLPGFGTPPNRVEYAVVNVGKLDAAFAEGDEVSPEALRERGLVGKKKLPVKVLGHGELSTPLTVRVDKVSGSAREKITAAGGRVE